MSKASNNEKVRFQYLLNTERAKQFAANFKEQFHQRNILSAQEAEQFLKMENIFLFETDLKGWGLLLFKEKNKEYYTDVQIIVLMARLTLQDEIEKQFRNIFQYFGGAQNKLTAQLLKKGLIGLGENLKEKDVDKIFLDLDLNGLGYIEFEEFLEAMMN